MDEIARKGLRKERETNSARGTLWCFSLENFASS